MNRIMGIAVFSGNETPESKEAIYRLSLNVHITVCGVNPFLMDIALEK